ncbi:MAG: peptidase domain-containing ABC transporter [Geminicoccaceae bacterium]
MAAASIAEPKAAPEPGRADGVLVAAARLLRLLDRQINEAELRAAATLPEAGADLGWLRALAARLGFGLRVQRPNARRLLATAPPFIILGRQPGEAWLVRSRTQDGQLILESAHGPAASCTPQIAAGFGDRVVRLVPAVARPGFWHSTPMRGLRGVLWQIGLASVVINLLALATPLFMMTVYNKVINHGALQTLDVLAVGMVTLVAFELALRSLRGQIAAHAGARMEAAIGSELVHHLLQLPYRFHETNPSGAVMERLRQVDQLRQFLTGQLPLLLVDLAFVGLFLAVLLAVAPPLGLVTLAAMPVFALLSVGARQRQEAHHHASFQAAAAKASAFGEAMTNALTVKLLALEPDMRRRYEDNLQRSAWRGLQSARIMHLAASLGQALQHLTALLLVYLGARMIVAGDMSIGALVASSILSARALAPMRQIAPAWVQLRQAQEAMAQLDGLLREPREAEGAPAGGELKPTGVLRGEGVSFTYPGAAAPALDGVSFDLEPGAIVGVAGPPGSGKSTLVRLLLGVETPDSGRILLDGQDLGRLPPAAYRPEFGVVPQEVQLFSGSIAENIAMGAADRSLSRVVAAARFVGADEFVRRLPQGYETRLGERGAGLSLGQRQLLAVARALVRNPRVLILDEATSALDPAAERHILANIRRGGKGRTIVMVTHREAVLQACDRVLLLEHGRLVLSGTPAEALARLGRATRLQAAG